MVQAAGDGLCRESWQPKNEGRKRKNMNFKRKKNMIFSFKTKNYFPVSQG